MDLVIDVRFVDLIVQCVAMKRHLPSDGENQRQSKERKIQADGEEEDSGQPYPILSQAWVWKQVLPEFLGQFFPGGVARIILSFHPNLPSEACQEIYDVESFTWFNVSARMQMCGCCRAFWRFHLPSDYKFCTDCNGAHQNGAERHCMHCFKTFHHLQVCDCRDEWLCRRCLRTVHHSYRCRTFVN
jgi:hypothetical protein